MVSEEYEVSLAVKRHGRPTFELWVLVEEGGKHACHRVSQSRGEVVQNDFWFVARGSTMTPDVTPPLETR